MEKNKLIKLIAGIVAVIVFIGALVGIIAYGRIADDKKQEALDKMDAQAKPYVDELEALRLKIEMLEREITGLDQVGSKMSFMVYNQCASNLYDEVYLYAQRTNSGGVFVISGDSMIGKEDCISLAQYDELLSNQWTCAIGMPANAKSLKDYVSALRVQFEVLDRTFPTTYYFEKGTFTKENLDVLKAEGFQTFIYDIDESYIKKIDQKMTAVDDAVYVPYMYASAARKIWNNYSAHIESGKSCAIATRYVMRSGEFMEGGRAQAEYDTISTSLLDMYETIVEQFECYRTLEAYRQERYESFTQAELKKQELRSEIEAIQKRREALHEIVTDIYAGKNN